LVLNKMDRASRITAKDIAQSLKHQVAGQIVLEERSVARSVNRGTPIVQSDRKSLFSQNIFDLARCLVQSLEEAEQEEDDVKTGGDGRSGRRVGRLLG